MLDIADSLETVDDLEKEFWDPELAIPTVDNLDDGREEVIYQLGSAGDRRF